MPTRNPVNISPAAKIGLIFFGILLSLAILELFLRLLGFGYNVLHPLPQDQGADTRIFCIGESTTVGIGAADPVVGNYPRQLEGLLKRRFPDRKIQCFFDQTIGQNTSEILLKLPRYIAKYRPQLIIFMVGTNNWWNMEKSNILIFNKNRVVRDLTLKTLVFLDRLRVWKLMKWIAFSFIGCRERWCYWTPEADRIGDVIKREGPERMELYNTLAEVDLSEMVRICKVNHIQVIICNYPIRPYGRLSAIQERIAAQFGVPFVDNELVFGSLEHLNTYLWRDHWHPNEKGYAVVAKNIYDCIIQNSLIR